MPDSLKIRFMKLPLARKLLLIGGFLTALSVFMPWYNDVDKFNIGETFLGISGPLYLAGFLVFIAGAVSVALVAIELLEKKTPKLPLKENQIHIAGSSLSLFMLILTSSAYFHPKFGVNLADKNVAFGMILALIGTGLVMLGGILVHKKREVSFDTEGSIAPLIDMERGKANLSLKKDITVGEAMDRHKQEQYGAKSSGWGPVQESINNLPKHDE
ncbi:hypothetical protein HZA40_02305 [Candidatus Peregrinibacteria bacterium]|nr:hypothetical protein [Candidatus Peregrinibacteria bacterium]